MTVVIAGLSLQEPVKCTGVFSRSALKSEEVNSIALFAAFNKSVLNSVVFMLFLLFCLRHRSYIKRHKTFTANYVLNEGGKG